MLKKFIRSFLPGRYKVGNGFIVDLQNSNRTSRQVDILIYDDERFAPIYQDEDFVIVESSTVYAAIEVKADIVGDSIQTAKQNMESVCDIVHPFTYWYLIIINANRNTSTYSKAKQKIGDDARLFVLNKYYLEGKKIFPNDYQATSATEVFLNNFLYHLMYRTTRSRPKIREHM